MFSNHIRTESSTIDPTSHTILNTILRTQSNKKEKKFLKSKLFNNLIKKQNTKKRNKKKQSNSCNIKLSNDQKRIEKLKKELNLKIIKPINKNEKLTEKEILYEKLNFPKLGPFIRKNHFIPFTKIISPFSLKSRNEFFYKKIFFNFINQQKKNLQENNKPIDNKINIDYAESSEQYDERLRKRNLRLLKEGKKIKHKVKENYSEQQMQKMSHSTGFIKCIVDYAYPDMILYRAKIFEESFKKKYEKLPPFLQTDKDNYNKEELLKSYLSEALIIK